MKSSVIPLYGPTKGGALQDMTTKANVFKKAEERKEKAETAADKIKSGFKNYVDSFVKYSPSSSHRKR